MWFRWAIVPCTCVHRGPLLRQILTDKCNNPAASLKILVIPLILYLNWEALALYLAPDIQNPFAGFFLISYYLPTSAPNDPRYAKGYFDFLFLAYYIVFFSFFRQLITVNVCRPVARYFGIKREAKLDRFGEQGYAVVYFAVFGAWGFVSNSVVCS